ncbi:MAG: glycosyltransferase, partial [Porphyrobacter sp.]|nr:glycosyltransferase [Porphyrobacter sp.]
MRIALVTDAWLPQVNGVVRTLTATTGELTRRGHTVAVISPEQFRTVACPTYPEIRLAMVRARTIGERLEDFAPDAVHIATEGPLGRAARVHCVKVGRPFTTAFHT